MQAVLISALTAAIVTLLIEYTAKPHLDARKDRIVERHRFRRKLRYQINDMCSLVVLFWNCKEVPSQGVFDDNFLKNGKKLRNTIDGAGSVLWGWQISNLHRFSGQFAELSLNLHAAIESGDDDIENHGAKFTELLYAADYALVVLRPLSFWRYLYHILARDFERKRQSGRYLLPSGQYGFMYEPTRPDHASG